MILGTVKERIQAIVDIELKWEASDKTVPKREWIRNEFYLDPTLIYKYRAMYRPYLKELGYNDWLDFAKAVEQDSSLVDKVSEIIEEKEKQKSKSIDALKELIDDVNKSDGLQEISEDLNKTEEPKVEEKKQETNEETKVEEPKKEGFTFGWGYVVFIGIILLIPIVFMLLDKKKSEPRETHRVTKQDYETARIENELSNFGRSVYTSLPPEF